MADLELPDALRDETRSVWKHYVDLLAPFRPDLHRYCWGLTGNLWDAEDLVQEAVIRGFGTLSSIHGSIDNPRGYLVRIATHCVVSVSLRVPFGPRIDHHAAPASVSPTCARPFRGSRRRRQGYLEAHGPCATAITRSTRTPA